MSNQSVHFQEISKSSAKAERYGLIASLAAALLMAAVGLTVTVLTRSQAIMLDGMFNAVYAVAAALTLHVSKLLRSSSNESFPFGYALFAPLIDIIKSLLISGVSLIALWYAIVALLSGGTEVSFGGAIAFAVFSTTICTSAALTVRRLARKANSTLLNGDVITWSINAAISGCLLLSFAVAFLLQSSGFATAARYVDSILVTILVLVSIGVPYSMGKGALSELLAKAPPAEERAQIERLIRSALKDKEDLPCSIRSLRIGSRWEIFVEVTIPERIQHFSVDDADVVRLLVEKKLSDDVHPTKVVLVFSRRVTAI